MKSKINVFWFRRDLRLDDNAGLYQALKSGTPVLPIFIFDRLILDKLESKTDRRVTFIYHALQSMQDKLKSLGSGLTIFNNTPENSFKELFTKYSVGTVFTNDDYEPYATERDSNIAALLEKKEVKYCTYKDHVIFEKKEIQKDNGTPYTIFTPYSKKWKSTLTEFAFKPYPCRKYFQHFLQYTPAKMIPLQALGFSEIPNSFPPSAVKEVVIRNYQKHRDFPGLAGTSKLGVHLRFGTISIRELARISMDLSPTYINELIWRDFYQMILWNFPQVGIGASFKPQYDNIEWRNDIMELEKWMNGQTGYPIVDAGMRELNETGFMHNRVRMITASFLCKHLLHDWRIGEAYFAEKLLDFDLASNNGGWQWASGSGCDAAPYFRIFNPYLQTKKFDPNLEYIKKWVPEFQEFSYPQPIVNHEFARKRCIEAYSKGLQKN